MQIPQSDILATNWLGIIFSNTVATYKFLWFVSIMQIHAKSDNRSIYMWNIVNATNSRKGDVRGVIPSKQKY